MFAFNSLCDWSRKLAPLSKPKNATLKPITSRSLSFSRALGSSFVFSLGSHWLVKVFSFLLIGRCDYFGFGFTTLNWKKLCCCYSCLGYSRLLPYLEFPEGFKNPTLLILITWKSHKASLPSTFLCYRLDS